MAPNSEIPFGLPPLLLLALCVFIFVYRKALDGKYQLGMHVQAIGFAIAIVGLSFGTYAELGQVGARIAFAGFVIGVAGAVIQILNKNKRQ